ncbi:MAG: cysteine--1-D-myo-inosityl 2-amino-2-deoxy-alpha-D-glucopyranoside ligase, partial [Nocardioidaceae bacterium]
PSPFLPAVPGSGGPLRLHDTSSGEVREIRPGDPATLYVCGITPYDATHMGHAATYVTFDLVGRVLRDSGRDVLYVQNVTDVDDPLLERAARDGKEWVDLAQEETALFREDMTALQVIAPDHYVGAVESIPLIVKAVEELEGNGTAYRLDAPEGGHDVYFDATRQPGFGEVSGLGRAEMNALFAERGGDPEREGKRDPLDPLLWRARRDGEPSWPGSGLGEGRPGWHVECATIALQHLGVPFDVQGGGTDLVFPHHEMSAGHGEALAGQRPFAHAYVHQAMVGYDGAKMSKSRGNLVLVSALRADGVDPMAIRLALLAHHYRTPWDWTDRVLVDAQERLALWRAGLSTNGGPDPERTVAEVRERLADDLDTPGALAAVDAWAQRSLSEGGAVIGAPGIMGRLCDALLGVRV